MKSIIYPIKLLPCISMLVLLVFAVGNLCAQTKLAYNSRPQAEDRQPLDLRPSYSQFLPYHKVCGVVVCQSDKPLDEIQTIIDEISLLQTDLKKYLAVPPANEKIELCIFSSEKAYLQFLDKVFPKAPTDRRALYVKKEGPGVVLIQKTKDFEVDLRHEMTHAILHASIANVPIWLDEGLAKYFEPKPLDRAFRSPYLSKVKWNCRFGKVPSLERLEKLRGIEEMSDVEYRESWAWVHFLIHDSPATHNLLAGYLQIIAEYPAETVGENKPLPKLAPYLRKTIPEFVTEFKRHYKNWNEN